MVIHKKDLGQNFLTDKNVIKGLVETAELTREDVVLEIGAGTGNVTREIAKRAGNVIAVEFDRDLIPILQNNLNKYNNVTILNKDILQLDLSNLKIENCRFKITKVLGSVPFQITSPLIHKLLGAGEEQPPQGKPQGLGPQKPLGLRNAAAITILIQKEVAEKITAESPNATYLSNFVKGLAEVTYIKKVSKNAFKPKPKVAGAIIKIEPHYNVLVNYNIRPQDWSTFLHRGFHHPRKMLRNTFDESILKKANINPRSRPQKLTVNKWVNLYKTT